MRKIRKLFSVVFTFVFTMFTLLNSMPAQAAVKKTVIPEVQFASAPVTEYTAGDRIQFNINSPNYGGKVEYRVVLWDDSKKSYSDLWNEKNGYPNRYYTKWQPTGNTSFTLGWPIFEPGNYRITVYAKRVGVASSKAALIGMNCDSYKQSVVFTVKPKVMLLDKEGQTYGSIDANKPETYKGDIKITAKNVTLNNAKLEGNIYISGNNAVIKNVSAAGNIIVDPGKDGSTTLDNVTVKNIEVLSGGQNSIHIKNVLAESMNVSSSTPVRIEVDGDTEIVSTSATGYVIFDRKNGTYGTITITQGRNGEPIIEFRGDIKDKVQVETTATIKTSENSKVSNLVITTDKVKLEGNFEKVEINSEAKVEVAANTKIENIVANTDAVINLDKTAAVNNVYKGSNTVIINRDGQVGPSTPSVTGESGGGNKGNSDDGNVPSVIAVSAVAVTGNTVVGQMLTAAPTPANATVTYQWKRSDAADGTYTNITGATSSTYTLTDNDAGKFIRAVATGTGRYTGTQTSAATVAIVGISAAPINYEAPSTLVEVSNTVTLLGTTFVDAAAVENATNWTIDTGTTNLQVDRFTRTGNNSVIINYTLKIAGQGTGTGTITIKGKAGAVAANKDTNVANVTIAQSDVSKVTAAKAAIVKATYTNLAVADTTNPAQKLAAVQAIVDGVKGETTAVVTAAGANYSVAISLNAASDTASITTATFVQSDAGKVAAVKAAIAGAAYTNLAVADTTNPAHKLAAVQAIVDGVKGETTAVVTAAGANFSVAISLNGVNDTVSITTATFVSSNAGLTSVAALTDTSPGTQSGVDAGNAIQWEISTAYAKAAVGRADIIVVANATFHLYSDNTFSTEILNTDTLALASDGQTVAYIKVTAEDSITVKYYAVTINRVLPLQSGLPAFTAGTPATFGTQMTVGAGDLGIQTNLTYTWYRSENAAYDAGTDTQVGTNTTTYKPVEADLGKYLIVVATTPDATGNGIIVTAVVAKEVYTGAESTAPTASGSPTSSQIILTDLGATYEYAITSIGGASQSSPIWQSSNIFTGLEGSTEYKFKSRIKETATMLPSNPSTESVVIYTEAIPGAPITGLDVPNNVLQIGETKFRTAATTQDGAGGWKSSNLGVATIDVSTGVVTALSPGTTSIAYTTSTSGNVNSTDITVYTAASVDDPVISEVRVEAGTVTPTEYTAEDTGLGQTITWSSSDTGKATINSSTGVITPVAEGNTTISYKVTESATGRVVTKGQLAISVQPAKTVGVGNLNGGVIMAQTPTSGRTYTVTTANIADGQAATVTWYAGTSKTSNSNTAPAGITIAPAGTVLNDSLALNVTVNELAPTVAGYYYFTITIDGVESAVKTLTIGNAATFTGVTLDCSYSTYANICLTISGLNKIDAGSTFDITKLTYAQMAGGPSYTLTGTYTRSYNPSVPNQGDYYFDISTNKLIIALTDYDIDNGNGSTGLDYIVDSSNANTLSAAEGWNVSNTIGSNVVNSVHVTVQF
ncbi:MAG: cell wall-binding protein [Clostridiales bacterium]|nr:cell wall-binding protein [Clostridiales bacterium]